MELDEHDYPEKSVEIRKEKERRGSRRGGDNEKDGGGEERASRRSRAEEQQNGEKVDREDRDRSPRREKDCHRSSRKVEREHDKDRDHRSRKWDRRERDKGKEKERVRDRKRERENERDREKDRERRREREREKERESERRSSSRSRRHDREVETKMDRARSRERALRERELERDMRERESKRFKEKKEVVEPEGDPERDQRTVFDSQVGDVHLMMDQNSQRSKEVGIMTGPGCRRSRGRQQTPLDDTHPHFSILHDESEDLDETQLSESTEQTSAQPEPVQSKVMAPQHHSLTGTQHRRAVRGPSRGLVLEKYVHTDNKKPKVQIFQDHPIGTEASIVANEISLYMWNHFPWAAKSFKHVAPRYRDALVSHIKHNIDFEDCTDEEVTACILKMAANRYRDRRYRLHKYCNKLQAKGIDPVTQPYRNWAGSSNDWQWLCEHFGSEVFQRRLEANKVNRSQIDSIHTQGSASFAQEMKRMGLSGVDAYAKFYQNKSGEFVTEEARQHHKKMLQLREQATREVGYDGDTGSQQVCLMTDDTILDTIPGRQLGSGHSMQSKKSYSSSSGRSDDASVPEAVRTSMSMMQDQISYWINRNQTLERIVAAMAERLGIDASELAPLQSHDAASAPPSRHISGQGSTSGEGNEANESDHT